MKIGVVHYSAPPVLGGVERVVSEQVTILREAGHQLTLYCSTGGTPEEIDRLLRIPREGSRFELVEHLRESVAAHDAILLHNVGTMPFHLELTSALRTLAQDLPSVRWICWVHDLVAGNPDYPPQEHPDWHRLMLSACPHWEYVAVSPRRAAEVRERLGVDCSPIPNGFCPQSTLGLTPSIAERAENLGWWDSDAVLLYPCRLVRRKSIETGIRIVQAMKEAGARVHYLVTAAADPHNAQSEQYRAELLALIETLGLNREVHFLSQGPSVGSSELEQLYKLADALLLPSKQEGFGLPLLEAVAHRMPAFCPNIEPMNQIPGVSAWGPDWSSDQIASWLIRQIEARDAIQARKNVLRNYRWKAVYRNFLAPLLTQHHS